MHKVLAIENLIFVFLVIFCLPPRSWALNDVAVIQGRIVAINKQHSKKIGEARFSHYILRIRKVNGNDSTPLFLTAEISVKENSFNDEIIHLSKSKGTLCQFSLSRRGMRYYIHEIFLLEGKGFGENIVPKKDGATVQLSENSVYHDENRRTIINNRKSSKNSTSYGETGVSIGGQ